MKLSFIILVSLMVTSCGLFKKAGVSVTSGVIQDGSKGMTEEYDWGFFERSIPANLKFVEGLHYATPSNTTVLANLIKGYAGYAYIVDETKHLPYKLQDSDVDIYKKNAIANYTKAVRFAQKFFEENDIDWKKLLNPSYADKVSKILSDELGEDDMVAVFYFAQAMAGLINLQKDNIQLVSQIPNVQKMMEWVCSKDPEFEYGACSIFSAVIKAVTPVIAGGNIETAGQLFKKAMKKYPHNLLIPVSYIEFYVAPMADDVEFAKLERKLLKDFREWEKLKNLGDDLYLKSKFARFQKYNIFNAMAFERFKAFRENKKDIF